MLFGIRLARLDRLDCVVNGRIAGQALAVGSTNEQEGEFMPTAPSIAVPHKEQLLRHGMKLFYARGYHGMTVDTLLDAANVPKGSFYHHFGTKEAFAQAVLQRYSDFQMEMLGRWSARTDLPAADVLSGYFGEIVDIFTRSGHAHGCLAGKFSTELSASSETLRVQIATSLAVWRDGIASIVRRGIADGDVPSDKDPDTTAEAVLALIQGALVVALASHDRAFLDHIAASIHRVVAD